jgi:dipeptide transport system substrate-binding protein
MLIRLLAAILFSVPVYAAEKTFVYCSEANPKTFNPMLADDGPTFNASSQMLYNRLIDFEPASTKIAPSLAEKWTVSKDGKTVILKLRKDVKWHTTENFKPTRGFNAEDVLFTFNRALKKDHPYHSVSGGNYIYYMGMEIDKLITEIKKVDDYTVQFTLARPEAPFLANLAMSFAAILSAEYAEQMLKAKTPEKVDTDPVGTGPFVLKRFVKDNSIRYDVFNDYFMGRSKLDKVVFAITPDPNVRFQKLKAGECHLIAEPSPQDLPAMESNSKLKLMSRPGANVGYLTFNVEKKPFDNVKVRQAVAMALNRENYLKVIYQGTASLAKTPIPPTVWGAAKAPSGFEYNPEKAKALLKEAGFPNGFETDLWTLPVSRPYNPNGKKMGELMQADLAKVGIKVKLVTYEWGTYLEKTRKGEFQMAQLGWTTDNGDPDNFMGALLTCGAINAGNMARWCDKAYDEVVVKGKVVTDIKARTLQYLKAQDMFTKNAPWVPLAHATVYRGLAKNVEGYSISPLGTEEFYPIDLK